MARLSDRRGGQKAAVSEGCSHAVQDSLLEQVELGASIHDSTLATFHLSGSIAGRLNEQLEHEG
jgi:hypothetical protein